MVALDATETLGLHRDQFNELRRKYRSFDDVLVVALADEVRRLSARLAEPCSRSSRCPRLPRLRRLPSCLPPAIRRQPFLDPERARLPSPAASDRWPTRCSGPPRTRGHTAHLPGQHRDHRPGPAGQAGPIARFDEPGTVCFVTLTWVQLRQDSGFGDDAGPGLPRKSR